MKNSAASYIPSDHEIQLTLTQLESVRGISTEAKKLFLWTLFQIWPAERRCLENDLYVRARALTRRMNISAASSELIEAACFCPKHTQMRVLRATGRQLAMG